LAFRGARIAAGASILLLGVVVRQHRVLSGDPCNYDSHVPLMTGAALAMIPYGRALWKMRSLEGPADDILYGLRLSMAWGALALIYGGCHSFAAARTMAEARWSRIAFWEMSGWGLFALGQAALVTSATRAAHALGGGARARGSTRAPLGDAALCAIGVFAAAALMASPWMRRPAVRFEDGAVAGIRAINSAQIEYEQTHPENGYAATLFELREAELLSEALAMGQENSYRFTLKAGSLEASGRMLTYGLAAEPSLPARGSCPSFFSDETGVIRFTTEPRPARGGDKVWP
jgi:hypothetical protein